MLSIWVPQYFVGQAYYGGFLRFLSCHFRENPDIREYSQVFAVFAVYREYRDTPNLKLKLHERPEIWL